MDFNHINIVEVYILCALILLTFAIVGLIAKNNESKK